MSDEMISGVSWHVWFLGQENEQLAGPEWDNIDSLIGHVGTYRSNQGQYFQWYQTGSLNGYMFIPSPKILKPCCYC